LRRLFAFYAKAGETLDALPTFKPDAVQTLAYAAVVLLAGLFLKQRIRIVDRLNIPAPVVGGLLAALLLLLLRDRVAAFQFDATLQPILNVAFFTSIGMSASLPLLKKGGVPVVLYLAMATFLCFAQNFLGMAIAAAFGISKLVGVMAGSVTLVGGPATGLAFAPLFAQRGVQGADSLAIAAATFGIVCGGLLGGPVGTWIIESRLGRKPGHRGKGRAADSDAAHAGDAADAVNAEISLESDREDTPLLRNLIVLAIAMGIGAVVSSYIQSKGVTLPAYIGAMMVASVLRNFDDAFGWLKIHPPTMDLIGNLCLLFFLAMALLNLRLWELAHLALPLVVILVAQVLLMGLFAVLISYPLMGKDYDSAVMASGLIGFALGTTANALTNMRALVERYGPSPKAFLVVPLVGAFFIDFINALIITAYLNWLGN
jgi:ESS family glutamate:Na+ symporter